MKQPETPEEIAAYEAWSKSQEISPQEKAAYIAEMTAQITDLENVILPKGFVGLEKKALSKALLDRLPSKRGHRMTDIDNLRLLAAARAADDAMAAYTLDGCADEIERLRWELRSYEQLGGDADRYSAIWREENPLNDMEPKT